MSFSTELLSFSHGADFLRADLHIHSFGQQGSYDVHDDSMTPVNIVDAALRDRIDVIAITDHNEIGNVPIALEYAKGRQILLVPGVECWSRHKATMTHIPATAGITV
jgi:predicted metal-dependent phosphoesterase TrpH